MSPKIKQRIWNFLRKILEIIEPEGIPFPGSWIYNKLMKNVLKSTLSFGELPDKEFEEFSSKHNISVEEIKRIYKKVVLWQSIK